MNTIMTDQIKFSVFGKELTAQVTYAWEFDDDAPDFDYDDELENRKEMQRFKSGELVNVFIKVTATCLGETGTNALGQVFLKGISINNGVLEFAKQEDMVDDALMELSNNIMYTRNQYKTLFG